MNFKDFIRPGKGASDITPLLLDKKAFSELIDVFADLFKDKKIDKIACIEGRGFILGSALAYKIKAGIIPLRIGGKLKNKTYSFPFKDYTKQGKARWNHKQIFVF